MEERLLRKHGDVSIGQSPKNTFAVPNPALPKSFTLFEAKTNGTYALVFERGMEGRVDIGGEEPMSLAELVQSKRVTKKGSKYVLPLTATEKGKVTFGNVMLLFQFVDAPPVMPRPQLPAAARGGIASQLEWPLVYILMTSFLVLGGSGAGLDYWWKETGQYMARQYDHQGDRIYDQLKAEVRLEREKKEEEKPPEEEKPEEAKTEEKTEEPTEVPDIKPEPPKQKTPTKTANTEKKPMTAAERAANREKLTAKVRTSTFLHVLGSDSGDGGPGALNTLNNGVHAANLDKAFDLPGGVTEATDGSSTFVGGPSAATGEGDRYKSLSKAEAGGEHIATQAVKTDSKDERGEIKVRANVGGGAVTGQTGTGQIDKSAVARVFSRRKGAIKYCYEKALKGNPNLRGKVTIRFTIGSAGRITDISASGNTTGNSEIASCIIDKVRGWRFDPPSGGSVTFSYPFLLDTK
ncbi:MAG: AgmX/PglI C-terminal domain-containing protein [Deltaproteobacteria bacterium]|nr:AgmX/PglI C-terminal domain-containing protein [Deltaproteobacteria bacterium]